ncbi:balbiani ring protein 6-like [Scaptodrosophila lebanonensis]|uniref:Balbiani ring protein 6-like n=1 Tax=Drosophila lebanonensis TaxID=7225 RepID=A0A6J2TX24_DROLE|nr:balbiani ring protein 6-like [Scaptodrosophila lebanonensis]
MTLLDPLYTNLTLDEYYEQYVTAENKFVKPNLSRYPSQAELKRHYNRTHYYGPFYKHRGFPAINQNLMLQIHTQPEFKSKRWAKLKPANALNFCPRKTEKTESTILKTEPTRPKTEQKPRKMEPSRLVKTIPNSMVDFEPKCDLRIESKNDLCIDSQSQLRRDKSPKPNPSLHHEPQPKRVPKNEPLCDEENESKHEPKHHSTRQPRRKLKRELRNDCNTEVKTEPKGELTMDASPVADRKSDRESDSVLDLVTKTEHWFSIKSKRECRTKAKRKLKNEPRSYSKRVKRESTRGKDEEEKENKSPTMEDDVVDELDLGLHEYDHFMLEIEGDPNF